MRTLSARGWALVITVMNGGNLQMAQGHAPLMERGFSHMEFRRIRIQELP